MSSHGPRCWTKGFWILGFKYLFKYFLLHSQVSYCSYLYLLAFPQCLVIQCKKFQCLPSSLPFYVHSFSVFIVISCFTLVIIVIYILSLDWLLVCLFLLWDQLGLAPPCFHLLSICIHSFSLPVFLVASYCEPVSVSFLNFSNSAFWNLVLPRFRLWNVLATIKAFLLFHQVCLFGGNSCKSWHLMQT